MITLFYDATPNGRKIIMALEELKLKYSLQWVRLDKGEQFTNEFTALSPSSKMPALISKVGNNEERLFESGSILLYLANKYNGLLPRDNQNRQDALNWLFWQTSTFGPTVGQATHFHSYAPAHGIQDEYSQKRFLNAAKKLYGDLDMRLEGRAFIAEEFSIADIAIFPWVRVARGHGIEIEEFPNVQRWAMDISTRSSANVKPVPTDREIAFQSYNSSDAKIWNNLFTTKTSGD